MTARNHYRCNAAVPALVLFAGLLLGGSGAVAAQATVGPRGVSPDSVRRAQECRQAAQIVERGKPAKKEAAAWARIVTCGASASGAVQRAWLAQRSARDTVPISATFYQLREFRDRMLFDAAFDVARDGSATMPSRVYSFMMLLAQLSDWRYPRYRSFIATGEYDVCRLTSVQTRAIETGTPLAADARTRALALARAAAVASANPAEVRSAARCLDQSLYRDSVLQAGPPPVPSSDEP